MEVDGEWMCARGWLKVEVNWMQVEGEFCVRCGVNVGGWCFVR